MYSAILPLSPKNFIIVSLVFLVNFEYLPSLNFFISLFLSGKVRSNTYKKLNSSISCFSSNTGKIFNFSSENNVNLSLLFLSVT